MIRASLVVLVVLIAILAFVLDHTWLYAVSGVSLLVTLGWFAVYGWSAYHRRKRDAARQDSDREHRLQDFGIVSIRPQEKASADASPMSTSDSRPSSTGTSVKKGHSTTDPSQQSTQTSGGAASSDAPRPAPAQKQSDSSSPPQGNGSSASTTGSATVARTSAGVPDEVDDGAGASDAATAVAASKTDTGITTSPRVDEPVLVPLVESLRAAVDAYSVCLLVQEDVVLEYHIRAIASQSASVQRDGAFSTSDPLLTASMSRQPITVRRIEGGRSVVAGYLRYYDEPPDIDHIALAPVPIRDTATTTFLLVDATENSDLGAPNARAIIEQYAETVALVLQSGATASAEQPASDDAHRPVRSNMHGDSTPSRTGTPRVRESDPVPKDSDEHPDLFATSDTPRTGGEDGPPPATDGPEDGSQEETSRPQEGTETTNDATSDAASDASSDASPPRETDRPHAGKASSDASTSNTEHDVPESDAPATGQSDDKPRPRREIIAEEMAAADAQGHELALALIHLNRAESIARSGMDAVATAEDALRSRLQSAAPDQRVVRFGELTYGVFFHAGLDHVEPWAIDLQDRMDAATGTLEGGASIGVALRGPRHDGADSLRADATRALREAYETGTCTIIE